MNRQAIIRVTGGNFRLLRGLLDQLERILDINKLDPVTCAVVEAARESAPVVPRTYRRRSYGRPPL